MPTTWDPDKYLRFGDERTRPSIDIVSRILIDNPKTIIDLGCGPGNSTRVLRQRWPHARVCGIDSSPDMIAAAGQAHPDQVWTLGSIEDWSGDATFDLVFSSAALQWVRGHTGLIADSGEHDRSFRRIVITPSGHRDRSSERSDARDCLCSSA
jgi:trans-aconitate 2-methyltransferase